MEFGKASAKTSVYLAERSGNASYARGAAMGPEQGAETNVSEACFPEEPANLAIILLK